MATLNWTFNSKGDNLNIFNWINGVPYFILDFKKKIVEEAQNPQLETIKDFYYFTDLVCIVPNKGNRAKTNKNRAFLKQVLS